jgi:MFS family permease
MIPLDKKVKSIALAFLAIAIVLVLVGTLTDQWYSQKGEIEGDEPGSTETFSTNHDLMGTTDCHAGECERYELIGAGTRTMLMLSFVLIAAMIGVFFSGFGSSYKKAPGIFLAICALAVGILAIDMIGEFGSRSGSHGSAIGWSFLCYIIGVALCLVGAILMVALPKIEQLAWANTKSIDEME